MYRDRKDGSFQAVVRPERLSDEVATAIASRIYDGTLQPNQRIPSEAQLCSEFEVSRYVIREAIARLRDDGLLTSRQGLGVFVTSRSSEQPFRLRVGNLSSQRQLMWIYELRLAIETAAAGLAAKHRNKSQLERLQKSLKSMGGSLKTMEGKSGSTDLGVHADTTFHKIVAEASHNPYYRDLTNYLAGALMENIHVARQNAMEKGVPDEALHEHEAIFKAIDDRDPEAASAAAQTHLENSMRRLKINQHKGD